MLSFDCGIYTIASPSGAQYVGSARSFRRRWRDHRKQLRAGTHHCEPLQRAFNKYGEQSFIFAKVAIVQESALVLREQEQMDERRAAGVQLYNVAPFASNSKAAPATKAKMSASRKGRKHSVAHAAAIGDALRGRKYSPDRIAKMVAGKAGKLPRNNASGYLGVHPDKGNWRARPIIFGRRISLGRFATPEDANAAIIRYKSELEQQ